MGNKRPFSDISPEDPPKPQKSSQLPTVHNAHNNRSVDRSRKKHNQSRHRTTTTSGPSVGQAKKRARNIQRLFHKDDTSIPENVRVDLERELVGLSSTISDRGFNIQRSKMISKYHMVRFFERRKAERLVKRLRTRLREASNPDEVSSLKTDLHVASVDVHYTKYHPHVEPYVSLYSKGGKGDNDKDKKGTNSASSASSATLALHAERPPIWEEVKQAMEGGEDALKSLQNRRCGPVVSNDGGDARFKSVGREGQYKPSQNKRKTGQAEIGKSKPDRSGKNGDDSDSEGGGFFQ